MRWIVIIFFLFVSTYGHAKIFKCIRNDGSEYYGEQPCQLSDKNIEVTKRDLALMRYELQQKEEDLQKQQKQQLRKEIAAEKLRFAKERQRLHAQAKCDAVKLQIEQLNKRSKHGYTVKQGQAFNRKLAECNQKRRIYCQNE